MRVRATSAADKFRGKGKVTIASVKVGQAHSHDDKDDGFAKAIIFALLLFHSF
jgi:hypothetical protein